MSPAREEPAVPWSTTTDAGISKHRGRPRNIESIDAVRFADNLQPPEYTIFGANEESRILFLDVRILDSTGTEPYRGDVLIKGRSLSSISVMICEASVDNPTTGERIAAVGIVPEVETIQQESGVRVIHGRGRTLMSGLGDAHTHFTWNGGDLDRLGDLGVEEHTPQCFLDSGYTMFVLRVRA